MTGRPSALSALARASTARVADSAMEPIRAEMRVLGVWVCSLTRPSLHLGRGSRRLPVRVFAPCASLPPRGGRRSAPGEGH
ncbi:hypothetical protein [Ornithinimicrobium kibberense]|uniref:hypothetical protein n=1 Tax=Ornithinimicrobium kibberense TaxID=282060 RepID=UPI0036183CAE